MRFVLCGLVLLVCLPMGCDKKATNGAPSDLPAPSPMEAGEQFTLTRKGAFSSETKVEFVLLAELPAKSKSKNITLDVQTKDGDRGGGFGLQSKWEITISGTIDTSSDARDWWIFQYKVKGLQSGSALIGDIKGPIRFSVPPGKRMSELLILDSKAGSYKVGEKILVATAREVSADRRVTIRIYDDKKTP